MRLAAKRMSGILWQLQEVQIRRSFLQLCAQVGAHKAALAIQAAFKRSIAQARLCAVRHSQVEGIDSVSVPSGHCIYDAGFFGTVLLRLVCRRYKAGVDAMYGWHGHLPVSNATCQIDENLLLEQVQDPKGQSHNGMKRDVFHRAGCPSGASAALVGPPSSRLEICPGWKRLDLLLTIEKQECRRREAEKLCQAKEWDNQWTDFSSSAATKPPSPYLQPARPGSQSPLKQGSSSSTFRKQPRPRHQGGHTKNVLRSITSHSSETEDLVPQPRYGFVQQVDESLVKQMQACF